MELVKSHKQTLSPTVAASAFAALGSEQRLGIVQTLVRAGPTGLTIGELGSRAGVTGSTLTHHLKTLAGAELVTQTKNGRSTVCAVSYHMADLLSNFLLQNCCIDAAIGAQSESKKDSEHRLVT